ncbi:MAG: hypothetical protein KKE86_07210 [Planctomycetes bacterium]|nr:hypothetical protein [Planctomycetota bacterium]MBU4399109.1 hypothetical protein [Planctomycetota bacterium]MCG2683421.1 hypothetical protein [Planctomycetales bacterium]
MSSFWWIPIVVAVLLSAAALFRKPRKKTSRATGLTRAKRRFHVQREHLEARFLQLASARANPDAPRWADCAFDDDVAYVRSRSTGELSALVAVTLAIEDCDDDPQAGTAVFRFDRDHWETDGRAILNLNPAEAIQYYRDELEIVEAEIAHPLT